MNRHAQGKPIFTPAARHAIASLHLCIDCLEERQSDGLDFYERHVANIGAALSATYRPGMCDRRRR